MSRLLHEPTIRLRSLGGDRGHASLEIVRELFGLREDPAARGAPAERARGGTRPSGAGSAVDAASADAHRHAAQRARARAGPSGRRRRLLGGCARWCRGDRRRPRRRAQATSRAGWPSSRMRCATGRSTSRCTPPRTSRASSPPGCRCSAPPRGRRRQDVLCGARALDELARRRARRHEQHPARGAAARRARGSRGGGAARQRRHAAAEARRAATGCDAIVLARAGLSGSAARTPSAACSTLSDFVPAPGQGTLALEGRSDDERARAAAQTITDASTLACLLAERALARGLGADCHTPLGAYASPADDGDGCCCARGRACPTALRG